MVGQSPELGQVMKTRQLWGPPEVLYSLSLEAVPGGRSEGP